ncbi:hypothetical protein Tco_0627220 [Tanacetum coccineum]|uniref:Uncharacterized protein n=1 Tax=Tanacetum coccineum TaxID=301880 RepID=A0ABQ4WM23_9ASTR
MNDSLGSINENGFFKDDINLDQLGSTMDKLMEENQSKHDATSDSDDSEIEEVSMPFGIPGGSLDDLEEDLDCYDGCGAQFYDLTEQEKAICDRYDIRLNSRCRK